MTDRDWILTKNPILKFFDDPNLPEKSQSIAELYRTLAWDLAAKISDGPEKTTALRKLLESKDCILRAM